MKEAEYIKSRLKELGEVERAATPGPWNYYQGNGHKWPLQVIDRPDGSRVYVCGKDGPLLCMCKPDLKLTAAMRTAAPGILRAMEALVDASKESSTHSFYCERDGKDCDMCEAISDAAKALGFNEEGGA